MIARLLPYVEWPRLAGTELETVWPHLDPASGGIVVVEDGDQIVGCWALFPVWHVEGLWIDEAHRGKVAVPKALRAGMADRAASLGIRRLVTAAMSAPVRRLLEHLGADPIPGEHFGFQVEDLCPLR